MKHFFTTLCLVLSLVLLQQQAIAQPKHGVTFREIWYNTLTPLKDNYKFGEIWRDAGGRGVEIDYNRKLVGNTWLVVPVKVGVGKVYNNATESGRDKLLGNLDVLVQQNLFKYGNLINPTIHAGIGSTYNQDDSEFQFNVPVGIGLNIRVFENLYITPQSQYRISFDDKTYWQHGIGATIYFGKPKDRDGDGISDANDKCPDIPGTAALMGCPDRDSDGITDAEDKCPDVPGIAALAGCPDKDSDGITDLEDDCPDVKGLAALKGCPDTDSDGITDAQDKCPTEAGPASNMGCPVKDRDGDGIMDADDACPSEKGPASTKGCPDRDGDGVADKDDACPDKKGDMMHKGCPDTDGDGVYDNEDRCVDVPGTIALKGCPEIKKEDKQKIDLAIKFVQFETGKAVLLPGSPKVLDDVASVLLKYPEYSLTMAGHTDNVGEDKMNLALSERRAKTCFDYLVAKGVPANRLSHAGYGETQPVADNATKAGRDKNRRVDFALIVK